jgi:serine/threonine protein kinase/class 3 adenylate cyclase
MNLGRYRLVAQIGAGPDGVAYRAETDEGLQAEMRLLTTARADAERWSALFRRIKLAALVGHPAALAVLETTLDHDPPFVVVERREVQSLREISVSSDEAARMMRSIAGALAAAHRVGLVHGHLSPTCMHFEGPRKVKIDFTGVQTDSAEQEAVYCAPEMKAGEPPSPPGDVYSLGALLRQLLVGQARVPVSLDRLVTDMLHADASARPSARQVEERLGAMLDLCGTVDSVVDTKESAGAASATLRASRTIDTPGAQESVASTPAIQQQERLRILEPGASRPFDTDSLPRLGRFLLLEKLGEGGMGAVYRAEDPVDGSIVAIKVLRAGFVGQPMALKRFHKEARLLAEVNNPYVTNLLEVNEDEGIHYLVMEFVAGRSLDVLLDERGRLEETMALSIMADVARALVEAHQRGIVHRDIKPENVLLAEPTDGHAQEVGAVKLSDFGLARHVAETESLMVTQAGSVVGTPAYMSPEQCSGLPLDPRSDVYSMGATLFDLLAGRPPFEGDSPLVLMGKHANEPPPSLKKLVPELSEGVCQVVDKTLAKAPEARYADAAALLRDIERVLRGEPTSINVHPKLPECDPARVLHYDWTWELDASPQQLWPYVSNTERLNRAVGLPAVQFSTKADSGRVKRYGRFRKAGMTAAWEEHPFEWIEARRFGVLRQYSQGPFKWLMSVVELSPRSGGGTTLAHRVRIEPVGLLGRTAAAVEVGIRGRRAVERVYRRIDNYLTGKLGTQADVDPFEESAPLSGGKRRRLEHLLDRLSEYRVDPAVVERLGEFLAHAPAQEVARIRPLALARRWGLPAEQLVAACLHGAREGLFVLLWDILCPICRIPSEIKDTLRELREHGHCPACNIDYQLDFAQSVEMIFRVHPEVRETELGTYCIGGPAHSPHVVAQVRVAPGERIELDLALGEGAYRLRGPQLPYALDFRVQSSGTVSRWELSLARAPGAELPRILRARAQVLALTNDHDQELVARVERAAQRDDALTAARAASLALFRELFPDEVLSPGQLISVANVTLLVTALHGARALYLTLGDAKAFGLLHDHFRQLDDCIRREGGALVKTIGEGVLAAFSDAASALRVALHLPALPLGEGQRPGVVIHRGPAMAATINDHLDYFGATVNHAMELRDTVRGGELLLTAAVANDPAVAALLSERGLEGVVSEAFVQRVVL